MQTRSLPALTTGLILVLAAAPAAASETNAPVFEPSPCPFALPAAQVEGQTVECGYLVVPEDRSDPGSRSIRIATAVFHPPGGATRADPIVYLEGGPGGSPLKLAGTLRSFDDLYGPFLASGRDVILLDQRGVGYSEPALECPGFSELYLDLFDQRLGDGGERLDAVRMRALKIDALAACAEELRAIADLDAYHTAAIAADVEDLRRALGYEELNLWGTSYGTWVALAAMRDHPEGIRSVILDAPLPPEADIYVDAPDSFARALAEVFDACEQDSACATAFPGLPTVFEEAVAGLDRAPVSAEILDPIRGQRLELLMDGPTFLEQVFRALYQPAMRAALPAIIHDARDGTFDTLLTMAQLDVLRQSFRSWGMYYSVLCHDEVPFTSLEAFDTARARHPLLAPMYEHFEIGPLPFELCPRWDTSAAPAQEDAPVSSDIPTLVTTGQYDPIVPPAWGQAAAEALSNASFHVFPGLAHGVMGTPCATRLMLTFLDDPGGELDTACIEDIPVAPFDVPGATPDEIVLEPFRDEALGVEGTRPAGWIEASPGQVVRASSATDAASLLLTVLPLGLDEAALALARNFGLEVIPDPVGEVAVDGRTWMRYATVAQGVSVEYALAPDNDATLLALLTSPRDERDSLVEGVLLPAIETLRPLDAR